MMAMVEREKAEEKAALGTKVAGSSQFEVLQNLWYGTSFDLPPAQVQPYLHAIMSVAAQERKKQRKAQWLQDRTLLLGLTEKQRDELFTLDLHPSKVEPIIESLGKASKNASILRRLIFYDALTMATQSAVSLDERLRAIRVAQVLMLSEDEQEEVEAIVRDEEQLRHRKHSLFATGTTASDEKAESFKSIESFNTGEPEDSFIINCGPTASSGLFGFFIATADSKYPASDGLAPDELVSRPRRHALHRLVFGTHVPLIEQRNERYVSSLLAVASAEGRVSLAEKTWLRDRIAVLELDPKLFAMFFDALDSDGSLREDGHFNTFDSIESVGTQGGAHSAVARAVLYDAMTMASSQQGMSEVKRERSRRVAARLGLSSEMCSEVFAVVEKESELRKRKRKLFAAAEVSC